MILITGVAGFVGFHLAKKKLELGYEILGIDNLNSYYDVELKKNRLNILKKYKKFIFLKIDLCDKKILEKSLKKFNISIIVHLAAQPGVRISFYNPYNTLKNNLISFINILEISRKLNLKKFIYASSSSVYGETKTYPFIENDNKNIPISVYGASKFTNEVLARSYFKNFNLSCFGLRFFTVYGPYGRPDMAYFKFLNNLKNNQGIEIYNNGNMYRDFTYIDDIINAICLIIKNKKKKINTILNIGKGSPDKLKDLIKFLEINYGKKFKKNFIINIPNGDIKRTYANTKKIKKLLKWKPKTGLAEGIRKFVEWYKIYYKLN